MALQDIIDESKDLNFQAKARLRFCEAAVAVMAEDPETANHAQRAAFAGKILFGEISPMQLGLGVLTNAAIQTSIETGVSYDADLAFVVNSIYNAFALAG
jgi:hypothetical protein